MRRPRSRRPGRPSCTASARSSRFPPTGVSTTACGAYSDNGGLSLGSAGVQIDGLEHDGTVVPDLVSQAGRWYDGVAATATSYVVASTVGPDGASWVERFAGAGVGTLDATFNATGAVPGRVALPNANLHAIRASGTDVYVAGESIDATAANRRMLVARITTTGAMGAASARAASLWPGSRGGNNSGQAFVFQGTNVIVGGSANLAGKAALGLARLNAAGNLDATFGTGGTTATPIGTPAINGFITGMAVSGNFVLVSGRANDPAGLATIAARYFHTGAPVPPPPLPAASTNTVDQITTTSARVNGAVNSTGSAGSWWVQYGTTTAYGSQSAAQPIGASNDDFPVAAVIGGLAPGTVYHARIVIQTTAGLDPGEDLAFTTLGNPAPAGAAGGAAGSTVGTVTGGTKGTTTIKKKAKAKKQCVVPKVTGKKLNKARTTVYAKGCKVQVKYVKSKKSVNTVLTQSRKAGKKLGYRSVVKLTVATKVAPKKS